jgi:hypothetical protein
MCTECNCKPKDDIQTESSNNVVTISSIKRDGN